MSADARRAFSQRVAQCLHFAGLALQRASDSPASRLEASEAAVQHLAMAYGAFVGEILAVAGGVSFADRQCINMWLNELPDVSAPEIARLRAESEQGAMASLLSAWRALSQVEIVRTPKAHETPTADLIPLRHVPERIDPERVGEWRLVLVALIDELREGLAEW